MNDVSSTTFSDRDKWNENYLAATFLDNQDFFARNGTKQPLTNLLSSMYPFYVSRRAYLKSMIFTPKLEISKLNSSLEEISAVIDNLDLLNEDENEFYKDKMQFFLKNFKSIYNLPEEIEKEHEDTLYLVRLYGFLKGERPTSDLEIDFKKTQKNLLENHILEGSTNILGIGATLCLLSSIDMGLIYENSNGSEIGFFTGSFFMGIRTLHDALKVYTFPTEIAYLYLREKCERADRLIEEMIKK